MKSFLTVVGALAFAVFTTGCSSVCEEAYEDIQECWQNKDCSQDPTGACDAAKALYDVDYDDWVDACEESGQGNCECEGEAEENAQKIVDNGINSDTCGPN